MAAGLACPAAAVATLLVTDPETLRQAELRLQSIEQILPDLSRRLVELQSGHLSIRTKANDKDLVTIADVESETRLKNTIASSFPGDEILAEESGRSVAGTSGFLWILDPVDGTVNYAHGLPLYGVSIGLVYKDTIVAGIVHMPALNNTYRSVVGSGATLRDQYGNLKNLRVSETGTLRKALVVTGFPYDREARLDMLVSGVRSVLANCRGIRRTGSASLDLCWLAEGRFDAHYELDLNPWDTCAAELIVREAGGMVTDLRGAEHLLNHKSLLATNGLIHKDMLQTLSVLGA